MLLHLYLMACVPSVSVKFRKNTKYVANACVKPIRTTAIIMPVSDKKTRGGQRPGAGRKPRHGERMIQKTVRLPPQWIDQLLDDFPSFQEAVEILVRRYIVSKIE